MKLIVGLGNPGTKYDGTRHNIGFEVIDEIRKSSEILEVGKRELPAKIDKDFNAEIAESRLDGEKFILIKPQTFMNLSGQSVAKIAYFYKVKPTDLWVIADDLDLPLGRIRVRHEGSSGGHKGLQSIIEALGRNDFTRIRVGISHDETSSRAVTKRISELDADEYVLSQFEPHERKLVQDVISQAADIIVEGLKKNSLIAHTY
jgi:PTH1 family peptidyl-tRNA hydrolase